MLGFKKPPETFPLGHAKERWPPLSPAHFLNGFVLRPEEGRLGHVTRRLPLWGKRAGSGASAAEAESLSAGTIRAGLLHTCTVCPENL